MDKEGDISVISSKKLTSDSSANNFVNGGFSNDDVTNRGSSNNLTKAANTKNINTDNGMNKEETNENRPQENEQKYEHSSAFFSMKKEGSNSNVDFTLPTSGKGRERSKSLTSEGGPYRGMGKEELLRHSSKPLWRNLRYACMSIVLTGWLALLITVVALVLTYPHCREPVHKDWWQKTVVYRIYVRSFMDSKSDGIGDIKGITKQLGYLKETGVGTISLSPIYRMDTHAVDDTHVTDHKDIDPVFGSLNDFKELVNKTHHLGMHILLDFIPNHTSDKHPWFIESKKDSDPRTNDKRSYYVWEDGLGSNGFKAPNKWQSLYDCSAWELVTQPTNSLYLHQFLKTQPDLNLRSEKVREELENILKFWLDLGVDGFYVRDADYMFEDYDLRDDSLDDNTTTIDGAKCGNTDPQYPYEAYNHNYTKGLSELFDMLARWRAYLDDYGNKTGKYKMLIADVDGSLDHVMHYYGLFNRDGVDFPLNKFSLNLQNSTRDVSRMVREWLYNLPPGRWANWMGGDDRSPRLAERLGSQMAMPYLIMTMLLPGTPFLYYGDEIGMRHSKLNQTKIQPGSRMKEMRGPMLWNNRTFAGFCPNYCSQPWIPPYVGYNTSEEINVQAKKRDPYSEWHLFKNLTQLRRDYPSFEYGDYVRTIEDDQVLSFVREFDGEKGFLVALNFADMYVTRHFTGTHSTIPTGGKIEIVSGRTSRRRGQGIDLDPLTLEPYQGMVVSWDYTAKEI